MNSTTARQGRPVRRPTTDTLTDRYVWAVLKSLPEPKRGDIERELRASIGDDIDARVVAGEESAAAERAVLLELGEPMKLAAGYTGRTLSLIGPELYADYVRLLKVLYAIVLPIAVTAYFVIQALTGATPGALVGGTIGMAISLIVHLAFWTTLMFVLVERAAPGRVGAQKGAYTPFDPDLLPSLPVGNGAGRSDLVASLVFLLLVSVALVWQQLSSIIRDAGGSPIPLIDPALWSFWLPYLLVMIVAAAVFAIVLYRVGRWTWTLVAANAMISIATTVPLAALIWTGNFLNPEFTARVGWGDVFAEGSPGAVMCSIAIVAITLWAFVDGAVKAVRADRVARGDG